MIVKILYDYGDIICLVDPYTNLKAFISFIGLLF